MMGKVVVAALAERLRQFRLAERATAAIEFALILPIMLTLYIGTVEGGNLITMDRKVQSVAGALGDLVARSKERIVISDLTDYFQAASGIITPYPSGPLVQVVTQVEIRQDGTTRVDWCRQYTNGTLSTCSRYQNNASFAVPTAMSNIARGSYIIVSEANYSYTPLSGYLWTRPISLYRQNFYMPRFGGRILLP